MEQPLKRKSHHFPARFGLEDDEVESIINGGEITAAQIDGPYSLDSSLGHNAETGHPLYPSFASTNDNAAGAAKTNEADPNTGHAADVPRIWDLFDTPGMLPGDLELMADPVSSSMEAVDVGLGFPLFLPLLSQQEQQTLLELHQLLQKHPLESFDRAPIGAEHSFPHPSSSPPSTSPPQSGDYDWMPAMSSLLTATEEHTVQEPQAEQRIGAPGVLSHTAREHWVAHPMEATRPARDLHDLTSPPASGLYKSREENRASGASTGGRSTKSSKHEQDAFSGLRAFVDHLPQPQHKGTQPQYKGSQKQIQMQDQRLLQPHQGLSHSAQQDDFHISSLVDASGCSREVSPEQAEQALLGTPSRPAPLPSHIPPETLTATSHRHLRHPSAQALTGPPHPASARAPEARTPSSKTPHSSSLLHRLASTIKDLQEGDARNLRERIASRRQGGKTHLPASKPIGAPQHEKPGPLEQLGRGRSSSQAVTQLDTRPGSQALVQSGGGQSPVVLDALLGHRDGEFSPIKLLHSYSKFHHTTPGEASHGFQVRWESHHLPSTADHLPRKRRLPGVRVPTQHGQVPRELPSLALGTQGNFGPGGPGFGLQQARMGGSGVNAMQGTSGVPQSVKDGTGEVRCRLLLAAQALHEGRKALFQHHSMQLRRFANKAGSAAERAVYHVLQALSLRDQGGGFEYLRKPSRHTKQELDLACQNYFTSTPYILFSMLATNGSVVPCLRGHQKVHIVDIGETLLPQFPALLKALVDAQQGDPLEAGAPKRGRKRGPLRSVRLTNVNIYPLGRPGRRDLDMVRVQGKMIQLLGEIAAALGVKFEFNGIYIEDGSLGLLKKLTHDPDEALAVCIAFELKYATHGIGMGALNELMECIQRIKPDVVCVTEEEIDACGSEFLPRFQASMEFLWKCMESHDSMAFGALRDHILIFEAQYHCHNMCSLVSCEGRELRTQPRLRSGSRGSWQGVFARWGFRPCPPDAETVETEFQMLQSFPDGFGLFRDESGLRLMWQGTYIISASTYEIAT